jgi:microcin C transport system substrate-binding protein
VSGEAAGRGPAWRGERTSLPATRRTVLTLAAGSVAAMAFGGRPAFAEEPAASVAPAVTPGTEAPAVAGERHGLSVFGDLKYGPDFPHFDWVNPQAPKGGRMVFTPPSWAFNQNPQTFNTFNSFVLRGDAPPRIETTFDTLMVRALDEPDAMYGLVARSVEVAPDRNAITFRLRPEARFHDGSPLTAEDVAWSLTTLKEYGHPLIVLPLQEMTAAEATAPDTVVVRFSGRQSRQLPLIVAGLPIFSKAWYAGRDFTAGSLEPPLASGPYRIGRFEPGRYIEYERVADWWGKNLPVSVGQSNFDVLRIEFYRDRQVAFEALKKGDVTYREEHTSRTWMTGYDFPAVRDGRVKRAEFPDRNPSGAQGFFLNLRRAKFADLRTREALGLAFDFEWSNANLFYGLYTRTESFFENSEMKATGLPTPAELALLEPFRGTIPDAAFGEAWLAPVSDGSGQDRRLLRRASDLLKEAGWRRDGGQLVDPDGNPFVIEFLENDTSSSRIVQPFIRNLKLLGIDATERIVDPVQYQARTDSFDFDVTGLRFSLSSTPGDELRQFFSSASARTDGSRNMAGIANPAVDALVEAVIAAPNRADMEVAARALDRVLRTLIPWVPNWYKASHTVAYWDLFGFPAEQPRYGFPVESTWWWEAERAAALGKSG